MLSQAEENYLKAIYHLEMISSTEISTNAIAKKLKTKASSVTDMVKKLSEKNLVIYKKYQGVNLSEKGRKFAASVIRKHRLWEVFLVDKLHFNWDEVHEIAEQLEHIKSEKLANQLDAYLGFPKNDPHGDPIPDEDGNITVQNKVKLSLLEEKKETVLLGVKGGTDQFLKYLSKKGIAIGNAIKIISKEPFDNSMVIFINNNELVITHQVAENLLVKED